MPRFLVKPVAREDFYVVWSTEDDYPLDWGTRKELEENYAHDPIQVEPERFRRANTAGTSMKDGDWYGWNQKVFDVRTLGKHYTLDRTDVIYFCRSIQDFKDDTPEVQRFLTLVS